MKGERRSDRVFGLAVAILIVACGVSIMMMAEAMELRRRGCAPRIWRNPVTGQDAIISPVPRQCESFAAR